MTKMGWITIGKLQYPTHHDYQFTKANLGWINEELLKSMSTWIAKQRYLNFIGKGNYTMEFPYVNTRFLIERQIVKRLPYVKKLMDEEYFKRALQDVLQGGKWWPWKDTTQYPPEYTSDCIPAEEPQRVLPSASVNFEDETIPDVPKVKPEVPVKEEKKEPEDVNALLLRLKRQRDALDKLIDSAEGRLRKEREMAIYTQEYDPLFSDIEEEVIPRTPANSVEMKFKVRVPETPIIEETPVKKIRKVLDEPCKTARSISWDD